LQCKRQGMRLRIGGLEIVTGRSLTVPSSRQSVEQCNGRACGPTRRPVPSFSFLGLGLGEEIGMSLVACVSTGNSAKPASCSSSSILFFLFFLFTASPKQARRALACWRRVSRFCLFAHPPSHCALVSTSPRGGYNRVQQAKDRRTHAEIGGETSNC
jgi:hypothetical protein